MKPRTTLGRVLAPLALTAVLVAACGTDTAARFELVQPAAAAEVLAERAPEVVLLDVRTPQEFTENRLAGSVNIDFYATDFSAQLDELDKETAYVVYCRSGNRSENAVRIMRDLGFTEVWEVAGGIVAWNEAGLPVER